MKWLSRKILELMGWTFTGAAPESPKCVVVGFPHTSNWDFILYLAVMDHVGVRSKFLAKRGLFKGPLGWLMRRWGGIPVDRSGGTALVETAIASFESHDELVLVIAPEGTRTAAPAWKSGFWRIADAADVPVVMAFIDAEAKTAGFGPAVKIDGDPQSWIDQAALFYEDMTGLRPDNQGRVAL